MNFFYGPRRIFTYFSVINSIIFINRALFLNYYV
jgi:hypothetical protein